MLQLICVQMIRNTNNDIIAILFRVEDWLRAALRQITSSAISIVRIAIQLDTSSNQITSHPCSWRTVSDTFRFENVFSEEIKIYIFGGLLYFKILFTLTVFLKIVFILISIFYCLLKQPLNQPPCLSNILRRSEFSPCCLLAPTC